MVHNVGSVDRAIRIIGGVILIGQTGDVCCTAALVAIELISSLP